MTLVLNASVTSRLVKRNIKSFMPIIFVLLLVYKMYI